MNPPQGIMYSQKAAMNTERQPGTSPSRMNEPAKPREIGERIKLGILDPLSLELPSTMDRQKTRLMEELMTRKNLYESEEGHTRRRQALQELYALLVTWVTAKALEQGFAEHELKERDLGIRIYTFGSYKLGVVAPDGDIDICIVNSNTYITRELFFSSFTEFLHKDKRCEKLVKVPEAYTPIVKFKFMGIDLDLLFAELAPKSSQLLVDDDLGNNAVLENCGEATVRCLNGIRVNQKILDLVPNQENFRGALRLIKEWATTRGTYSNVLGYFGGITYAILVAQVCQLYPHFLPSQLVCKFFKLYSRWDWRNPVTLCPIEKHANNPNLKQLHVWSPHDPSSRAHLMPILTPAFPSMNSTHNVSKTTKQVLIREFERGDRICSKIETAPIEAVPALWDDLIRPCELFAEYEHFLFIEAYACTEECFKDYCGFVDSKLRLLVKRLEMSQGIMLRPWPEGINYVPSAELSLPLGGAIEGYKYGQARIIGFDVEDPSKEDIRNYAKPLGIEGIPPQGTPVDFREAVDQWLEVVRNWQPNRSTYKKEINCRICYRSRVDLPSYSRHSIIVKNNANPQATTNSETRRVPDHK